MNFKRMLKKKEHFNLSPESAKKDLPFIELPSHDRIYGNIEDLLAYLNTTTNYGSDSYDHTWRPSRLLDSCAEQVVLEQTNN